LVRFASHLPCCVTFAARLLLADANARRRDLLLKHLLSLGYRLQLAHHGLMVQRLLQQAPTDLAILDAALPQVSGIVLCRRLRGGGSTMPLLVLAASDHYSDRVAALAAGADDALSFPFALEEFSARLQALLRRARMGVNDADGAQLVHRDLIVNTDERLVHRGGDSVKLTVKEYELLLFLLRHKQQVLPRHQILIGVWGDTWCGDGNLLEVYIRYLRKKIERPDVEPLIHTIRGVGYMLK
jgi:two-component system response regulator MprA